MNAPLARRFILIICVLFLLSAACAMPSNTQPTRQPDSVNTLAAQTIDALMTQSAGGATQTPAAPTQAQSEPTLRPSATPQPTNTQAVLPTATATRSPVCDMAGFMQDVTIADGTPIAAGMQFVKTWRLRNEGTCTWTPDYAIVFDKGESMGAPASQKLDVSVPPGQTVDISVTLRAPGSPGEYRGDWKLRNASGVLFGLGSGGTGHFYVVIKVVTPSNTGSGYDFAANYCMAEWTGNGKAIPCTGAEGSADGFVLYRARPILESGYVDDEPALLTNPPRVNAGVIRGKFPAYTVKDKDHFSALLSCESNSKNCSVRFQLDYQIDDGGLQTLNAWTETFDEQYQQVDVDLSSLAGKNVKFILTVLANGASDNDRALWLAPRIANRP